ncbi:uncharacterized protein LOC127702043 [Mytilus californianus]|uniref:uncharacterized protein LOC127702043 n=1 Tax=Mytilus californianus TaxID=6549 RepID=UPI002245BB87|nr:uncharacterized protein LOC127702043 [Mytilus californianus]
MDSSDRNRAKCFIYDSPKCTAREHDDIILEKSYENSFTLVLQTAKKNVEGDWKCFHGSDKANVNIHLMKGTIYSADIHLSGEIMKKTTKNKFTLTCYSCWLPATESVNFFVNGGLEDSVRYKDGKCYKKRKLCSPSECTCSNEGNKFTWSFLSDLSFLEFSCEMRFKDEKTSTFSIQTANLSYNESVFQQKITTNKTYAVLDKNIHIDGGNLNVSYIDKFTTS